jgi:tetratricopeptide (TPR) repeat protein
MIPTQRFFPVLIMLCFGAMTYSQGPALVRFDDLVFNSDFEKEAFTNPQNNLQEYLSLFLAVSPSSDKVLLEKANQMIRLETERINDKRFAKNSDEKKVKTVYESVNQDILNTYKEKVLFPEIISAGNYNCLTSSAYYGFLFTNLGISFEFRESSSHVHPVAFPGSLQIKVETTDPVFGFQYFDSKLKIQFVSYLISSKIISKEEAGSSTVDNIFYKYYFPATSIGMKELAGLQYLNDALYNYAKDNFVYAFRQIQKAYFLYPSDRIATVMLFLLSRCLTETEYKTIEDASFLVYASRFTGGDLNKDVFLNEYRSLTDKVLLQRSQTALYDQIFQYLMNSIEEGAVRQEVEVEYYIQKGNLLMNTYRVKEALMSFEKGLAITPENLELQIITIRCLSYSFGTASSQEIVNSIENFEQKFPEMHDNDTFIGLQMLGYLQLGEEKFDFEQPTEGEMYLKKFENLCESHHGVSVQYEKVGDAYSAAAVYYFKRNNKSIARTYLNRGLAISPENYQLMYRLRALE